MNRLSLQQQLDILREAQARDAAAEESRYRREVQKEVKTFDRLKRKMRPATFDDYQRWLWGRAKVFKLSNLEPVEYPFSRDARRWFVASKDIKFEPLYGAFAIGVIIPKGIRWSGELGHIDVFTYEGYQTKGYGGIRVFSDMTLEE